MFRYLGFLWDPASSTQTAASQHIDMAVRHTEGWRLAHSARGLCVYTTGDRPAVNGSYALPGDRGVILGRLFRRHEEPSERRDINILEDEGERIVESNGRRLIEDYWGRYVVVLRNDRGVTQLLRDPSGTLPCYSGDVHGVAVFFSWLEDMISFAPDWPAPRIDWQAIAARIALGQLGGRTTALEGISQVLPGQLTPLREAATMPVSVWSAAAIARTSARHEPDVAAALLRRTVMDCARAWSSCYESILLRLSGGVDSAILLGSMHAADVAARVTCLNYHSQGADSDERRFARLAANRAGVELVERERDAGFRLDDVLAVSLTPTPEVYSGRMGTARIDASVAAEHRAPAMFTGTGGDQLFFQARCTWPAADYLNARGLDSGFFSAALDAARLGRVSLLQAMWRAILDQRRRSGTADRTAQFATLARPEALDAVPCFDRYVHPDLPAAFDLPIGKFNQLQDLIDPIGYYDPYLREAAPELVSPLLSQPVLELCLALPTWLLTKGGRGRALARRAFACDMPPEICNRLSKGGMQEHVATVLHRNLPLARGLLLDGHLVRQGILDRSRVEAALRGRLSAPGGHLSEIHECIAIEAWLQRVSALAQPPHA